MRIGVMAAGAVGAYFGGRLAAAGHDVVFFARGANLAALRQNGLKINSVKGDLVLPRVNPQLPSFEEPRLSSRHDGC